MSKTGVSKLEKLYTYQEQRKPVQLLSVKQLLAIPDCVPKTRAQLVYRISCDVKTTPFQAVHETKNEREKRIGGQRKAMNKNKALKMSDEQREINKLLYVRAVRAETVQGFWMGVKG